jgi:hypothetical protein
MSERTTTGSGTITRMIDPKDITFLEIFPEWAVTYPVWWDGGEIGGESLAALGVSAELLMDLEKWQNDWDPDNDADPEHYWMGTHLQDRLQAELPNIPIRFDS